MALVVNHNMMAANTARMLNTNYNKLNTSVQRLSSGLRINSAADDAAGLAIRELMRSDITTLNQGIRNANDAISLIQTADGALSVIDEKLIRMKELAEQAATGTYNSTQRLIINSEFQAMGMEIDRIANATDFNGIHLLNGTLSGTHDGSGLESTGAMKIHFGTGNDSAEDYYYIDIDDCTLKGLGLRSEELKSRDSLNTNNKGTKTGNFTLNDYQYDTFISRPKDTLKSMNELSKPITPGIWYDGYMENGGSSLYGNSNFMFIIPKGTKDIIINTLAYSGVGQPGVGDNDIELFTRSGVHLAGTPLDDFVYTSLQGGGGGGGIDVNPELGFTSADYDGRYLNSGSTGSYDKDVLKYSTYKGMVIGYTGDPDRHDANPNNGASDTWEDYETLTIDEVTEDLIFWYPGCGGCWFKVVYGTLPSYPGPAQEQSNEQGEVISIETQEKAQKALPKLDDAIVQKDKVRAHLGALQNRFENTITNLEVQAENLQASESRISDVDVATEMTEFIRNQILTQTGVAMLAQANNLPQMALQLLQ